VSRRSTPWASVQEADFDLPPNLVTKKHIEKRLFLEKIRVHEIKQIQGLAA